MGKKLFITGTGTEVGKTYVTGLILKKLQGQGLSAGYYKAAMSGNERLNDSSVAPGDALNVKNISGIPQPTAEMCAYVYENALSPHLAAKVENKPIELDSVLKHFESVCAKYKYVTIEGSGGIVCPLRYDSQKIMLEDVIKTFDSPCVIVADAGLGTINATVLTAEYMKAHNIAAKGIIVNRYVPGNMMHEDNIAMCEDLTGLKVIARVSSGEKDIDIPVELLKKLYA